MVKLEVVSVKNESEDNGQSRDSDFSISENNGINVNTRKIKAEMNSSNTSEINQSLVPGGNTGGSGEKMNLLSPAEEKNDDLDINNSSKSLQKDTLYKSQNDRKDIKIAELNVIPDDTHLVEQKGAKKKSINKNDNVEDDHDSELSNVDTIGNELIESKISNKKKEKEKESLSNSEEHNVKFIDSISDSLHSDSVKPVKINKLNIAKIQTYFVDSTPRIETNTGQITKGMLSAITNAAQTSMSSKLALESNTPNSSLDNTDCDSYGDPTNSQNTPVGSPGSSKREIHPGGFGESPPTAKSTLGKAHNAFDSSSSPDDQLMTYRAWNKTVEDDVHENTGEKDENIDDNTLDPTKSLFSIIEKQELNIPKIDTGESCDDEYQKLNSQLEPQKQEVNNSKITPLSLKSNSSASSIQDILDSSNSILAGNPDEIVQRLMKSLGTADDLAILASPTSVGIPGPVDSISDFDKSGGFGNPGSVSVDSLGGGLGFDIDEILSRYKM